MSPKDLVPRDDPIRNDETVVDEALRGLVPRLGGADSHVRSARDASECAGPDRLLERTQRAPLLREAPVRPPVPLGSDDAGSAFANGLGHSGYTRRLFNGLFATAHAATVTNAGRPLVVSRFGCWKNYFVDPECNALGHFPLLSGYQGAAATSGTATLTEDASDAIVGPIPMRKLFHPCMTMGQALVEGGAVRHRDHPERRSERSEDDAPPLHLERHRPAPVSRLRAEAQGRGSGLHSTLCVSAGRGARTRPPAFSVSGARARSGRIARRGRTAAGAAGTGSRASRSAGRRSRRSACARGTARETRRRARRSRDAGR